MSRLLSLKKKNANGVIELPKGNYEIEAHLAGRVWSEKMYDPYYGGV